MSGDLNILRRFEQRYILVSIMNSFARVSILFTTTLTLAGCSSELVDSSTKQQVETVSFKNNAVDSSPQQKVDLKVVENEPTTPVVQLQGPQNDDVKKQREPLFKGWEEPDFAIVITGNQHGYIEPCGCTGLANQKGGLARRTSFLQMLKNSKKWNVVAIDAGDQVRRVGRQAEIKFQKTASSLKDIGYTNVAFGPDDLRLSVDALANVTIHSKEQPSVFVSANVSVILPELTKDHDVILAGGKRIGVTSVIDPAAIEQTGGDEIVVEDIDKSLAKVLPKLRAARCDLYVLMVNGSYAKTLEIAKKYPQFRVVVTTGGGTEPENIPTKVEGTTNMIIKTGAKGMYAGVLGGVATSGGIELNYQRVPLDDRFPDSKGVLEMLAAYQKDLELQGLAKLGVQPLPHPTGNEFVGSATCGECHTKAYDKWKNTPHAHATIGIVEPGERSEIPRHFDPECLSCHVTGWNPQRYYPYRGGYLSLEKTKHMTGNGCENCHGPGSQHVAAENGDIDATEAQLAKFRSEMRLSLAEAKASKCFECHDLDNDPNFHHEGAFEEYWKQIEHKGLD